MVYIPILTPYLDPSSSNRKLYPRKGGGGGGKSSGGKSGSSGKSGGSSGSSGSGRSTGPVSVGGGSKGTSSYNKGGGKPSTIPNGLPFSGRSQGGGTRAEVFGSRQYGSGYPGIRGRGVGGRGFPFYFWPIIWGSGVGLAAGVYLHDSEYGDANNSSRPGGVLTTAMFGSGAPLNTTFYLVADNTTTTSLVTAISANCTYAMFSGPTAFDPNSPTAPKPEEAVQYYRASSVVLSLAGYNDTAALSDDENAPDVPLPTNIDTTLLNCLNQTIGAAVPLVDSATGMRWAGPSPTLAGSVGFFWVVWVLTSGLL